MDISQKPEPWISAEKTFVAFGRLSLEIAEHKRNIATLDDALLRSAANLKALVTEVLAHAPLIDWAAVDSDTQELRRIIPEWHDQQTALADKQIRLDAMSSK